MSDVYKNIASEITGEYIAWINVTNPLFEPILYDKAILRFKKMNKNKYDCLLSTFKIQDYFYYKNKPINFKSFPWPRSQDLIGLEIVEFCNKYLKKKKYDQVGILCWKKATINGISTIEFMGYRF